MEKRCTICMKLFYGSLWFWIADLYEYCEDNKVHCEVKLWQGFPVDDPE